MTTAGFYDDDFFRNSEAMRAIQEMARLAASPAVQAIHQANAANIAKIMEAVRPVIAAVSADAAKTIGRMAIEMPKIDFSFKNLQQIKLGDDAAREVASSIDYTGVARSVATEVEETAPEEIPEVDLEAFTEQELDEMTSDLFERHPDLADKFYNDPRITTLNAGQKKMLAWQWALTILFGIALLVGWAKVDGNVDYVKDVVTDSGVVVSVYMGAKKMLEADESGDKKEGA